MAEELATYQVETGDPDPLGLEKKLRAAKATKNAPNSDPLGLEAKLRAIKEPAQPKQEQPTFKPMTDWLNVQQGYQPTVPENAINSHNTETEKSSERIKNHLADIDNSVRNLLYEHKKDLTGRIKSQELGVNPSEQGPINFQAQQLAQKDKQDVYVSPGEVESFKSEMPANHVLLRRALDQKAKDLNKANPIEAATLKADIYRMDRQNNPEKESKIAKNVEGIKNGELDYDIVNGQLVKPEGFLGSLATGYKEKVQAFDDYGVYQTGDKKAILDLINKRLKYDPDEAAPKPKGEWVEGFFNEMGRMAGGQPLKPLIGGAAAGIAGPEAGVAAASAITAPEMYKLTFGATLPSNYAAIKKAHPDWPEEQQLQEAIDFTHNQANIDALSGAAMGVLGAKVGLKPTGLNSGLLQKSLGSALKQVGQESVKKTLEGLGVGTIGASGQLVKNMMAQQEGIPVDESEGLKEQLLGGLKMTAGMHMIAKFPEVLNPKTYNQLLQSFKNVPKEQIESELNNLQQSGQITEDQAKNAATAIKEHADIDNSIKPNVPQSDRLKVQEKIKKRNELEASLETTDKAYHPDIKEQIKSLNEEIVNLSNGKERGELQQLVDKESKDENIKGYTAETLKDASENDLKRYFKEIAEQAHDPNSEATTRATFGDNIVNKAKELYPQKESKISVIQPGEIKQPETITIKPREEAKEMVYSESKNKISEHNDRYNDLNERAKRLGYKGIKQLNSQEQLNENASSEIKQLLNEYGAHNEKVKSLINEKDIANLDDDNFGTWVKANDVQRDNLGRVTNVNELSTASKRIRILKDKGMTDEAAVESERLKSSKKKDNWTVEEWNKRFDEDLSKEEIDNINKENSEFNAQLDKELNNLEPIKPQENAIQEPSTGGVLQYPQEGIGETGGERGGMEPGKQGEETAGTRAQEEGKATGQEGVTPPPEDDLPFRYDEGDDMITSIKNATTAQKVQEYGLTPAVQEAARKHGAVWQEAIQKVKKGFDTHSLVNQLKRKPRPLTDTEDALLLIHQIEKEANYDAVNKEINEAAEKGDVNAMEDAKIRRNAIKDDLQDLYDIDKKVGTLNARGLSARQMMADRRYSLVNMEQEMQASQNGKPLTEEQKAEVQKDYDNIRAQKEAYEKRVAELEKENKKLVQQAIEKKIKRENQKETVKAKIDKIKDDLKSNLDELRKIARNQGLGANPIALDAVPVILKASKNLAKLGIVKIEQMAVHIYDAIKDQYNENIQGENVDKLTLDHVIEAIEAANNQERLNAYKARTQKSIDAITEKMNIENAPQKQSKPPIVLDKEAIRLKALEERAKAAYEEKVKKQELKNRTPFQKTLDTFVKWERAFKLTAVTTLGKLSGAGITRLITSPIEEGIGGAVSAAIPKLAKQAEGEGGFNVKAEAKAIRMAFTKGMQDSYETLKLGTRGGKGKSDLDIVFGKKDALPPEAIDFFGQLHSAIKAPVKRAAFERSFEKRIARNIKNGVDVSDPMVQTKIAMEAYKDGQRAIFMQDNFVSDSYRNWVNLLEKSQKYPTLGKSAASFFQWMVPFVKVPTNIVGEVGTHVAGVPIGVTKLLHASFTKGIEHLAPEEADMVMRNLKKGSLGVAALLIGYFNPNNFGGYYQKYEKRDEGDIQAGEAKMFGVTIPKWLLHSPIFETMQLGATVRRAKDKMVHGIPQGITEGMWAGTLGLAEEEPLLDQPMRFAKIFESQKERTYYLGELAKSTIAPMLLQNIAKWIDPAEKRKPETIWEHIEMGIPGLRENVKEKGGSSATQSIPSREKPTRIKPTRVNPHKR